MECHSSKMSLKLKYHSNWNVTQLKCHSNLNVTQIGMDDWTIWMPFLQVYSWHINRYRRRRKEGEEGRIESEQENGALKEDVKRVDRSYVEKRADVHSLKVAVQKGSNSVKLSEEEN